MTAKPWFGNTKNIYCIGRNYREHAKELNNPVPTKPIIFLKSPSSLRSLDPCEMAYAHEEYDFEAEIILVLKDHLKLNTQPHFSNLAGLSLGLDLTRRQVQSDLKKQGHPWAIAKNFKGAGVLSSLASLDGLTNETNIEFSFHVNDELKQLGHSQEMIFSPLTILTEILKGVELFPGDLVFTGTPKGVGKIKIGDKLSLVSKTLKINDHGYL